ATITNGTRYDTRLAVSALAGGTVNLSGVTQVTEPTGGDARYTDVNIKSDGAGSTVNLAALTSFTDVFGSVTQSGQGGGGSLSTLTATNGGNVLAISLTSTQNVGLTYTATGSLQTPKLTTVAGGSINVAGASINL